MAKVETVRKRPVQNKRSKAGNSGLLKKRLSIMIFNNKHFRGSPVAFETDQLFRPQLFARSQTICWNPRPSMFQQ